MSENPNPTPPENNPPAPPAPPAPPSPPQGIVDPTGQGRTPMFIAWDQNDLDGKFGSTRTSTRQSLAKQHGYETFEAFDAQIKTWKTNQAELEARNTALRERDDKIATMTLNHAAERQSRLLGVPEENIDDVLGFVKMPDGALTEAGEVNTEAIKGSVEAFLNSYPAFKQPKTPTTVGQASVPASAAKPAVTLDEQIKQAHKEGRLEDAILLETQKLPASS